MRCSCTTTLCPAHGRCWWMVRKKPAPPARPPCSLLQRRCRTPSATAVAWCESPATRRCSSMRATFTASANRKRTSAWSTCLTLRPSRQAFQRRVSASPLLVTYVHWGDMLLRATVCRLGSCVHICGRLGVVRWCGTSSSPTALRMAASTRCIGVSATSSGSMSRSGGT